MTSTQTTTHTRTYTYAIPHYCIEVETSQEKFCLAIEKIVCISEMKPYRESNHCTMKLVGIPQLIVNESYESVLAKIAAAQDHVELPQPDESDNEDD